MSFHIDWLFSFLLFIDLSFYTFWLFLIIYSVLSFIFCSIFWSFSFMIAWTVIVLAIKYLNPDIHMFLSSNDFAISLYSRSRVCKMKYQSHPFGRFSFWSLYLESYHFVYYIEWTSQPFENLKWNIFLGIKTTGKIWLFTQIFLDILPS